MLSPLNAAHQNLPCYLLTSHTRTVVRECCKDDDQSQWEKPKFDPATPKPLNRSSPTFTYVIVDIYHPAKFRPDRIRGYWFVYFGGFFKSSTAKMPARILTQNTSKDAVPRKDVPFRGRKTKS